MKFATLQHATRITVVGKGGIVYENYELAEGMELHLQDDGRTLKVFPLSEEASE